MLLKLVFIYPDHRRRAVAIQEAHRIDVTHLIRFVTVCARPIYEIGRSQQTAPGSGPQ